MVKLKDFSSQIQFSRTFPDSLVYSITFQAGVNPATPILTMVLQAKMENSVDNVQLASKMLQNYNYEENLKR